MEKAGKADFSPPNIRKWMYLCFWFLTWMSIIGGFVLWTIYWSTLKTDGTNWSDIISQNLVVGYGLGSRDLSPAAEAGYAANLTAAAQEEADEAFLEEYKANLTAAGENFTSYVDEHEMDTQAQLKAFNVSAPAVDPVLPHQTVDVFVDSYTVYVILIIVVPFFLMGLTGIMAATFPSHAAFSPHVTKAKQAIRRFCSRPIPPVTFWRTWVNGLSIGEFVLFVWVLIPQVWYSVDFFTRAKQRWDSGQVTKLGPFGADFSQGQFWLNRVALWPGILFLAQVPFLMVPIARGSLINIFLGVKYAQAIKFHRWVGTQVVISVISHGLLYQVLWLTGDGGKIWVEQLWRWSFSKSYHVSNLAGFLAWLPLCVMTITLLPPLRRSYYYIFYYSHVIGAGLFIVFACFHLDLTAYFVFGATVWGIDTVYRWIQTSYPVSLSCSLSEDKTMVTLTIPLEDGVLHKDDSHLWICIPEIAWLEYHPFSIASTAAEPSTKSFAVVHAKVYNRWTKKLAEIASGKEHVLAKVQGPYDGHNLSTEEQEQFSSMVYFAGGVGVTAMLASLRRSALQRKLPDTPALLPKISLIMVARSITDLHLVAGLLSSADVLDIQLYFTGKAALQPAILGPLGTVADSMLVSEDGKGSSDGSESHVPTTKRMRKLVSSPWEIAAVWVLASFAACWVAITVAAYAHRSDKVQLEIEKVDRQMVTYWSVPMQLFVAVLLPAAIIMTWRAFGRGSCHTDASPGLPPLPLATISVDSNNNAFMGLANEASVAVPIHLGRPDIAELLDGFRRHAEQDESAASKSVAVWSAGPKAFNNAIYNAVYTSKYGAGLTYHQLAFEL